MCLANSAVEVRTLLKKDVDTFDCYKILSVRHKNGRKTLNSTVRHGYIWKAGINKSDSKRMQPVVNRNGFLAKGIHTFKTKKIAKDALRRASTAGSMSLKVIVKVTGKKKDLIGASADKMQMLFTKVTLSKEEYARATK